MAAESMADLEEFLKRQARQHGVESAQAAAVMVRLGTACLEDKSYRQAEGWLRKALTIQERLGEESHVITDTRRQLNNVLAMTDIVEDMTVSTDRLPSFDTLQKPADEFEEAVEHCQIEIASMRERGVQPLELADALLKLGKLYGRRKMFSAMEPLLLEALAIRESELGQNHCVAVDLKNLAKLYYFQRRYDDAEKQFKRAMNIRAAALGPLHPHVADIAKWYAKSLRACDRVPEAEAMEDLVRKCQAEEGTAWDNYKTAAVKAMANENYPKAETMWLAALDEAASFSDDDPRLCATLENLAQVYFKQAKYDQSEALCKRILHISERELGSSHADVAQAASNMALVCDKQGKYQEASMLYQQALTILEKLHGVDDPSVIALRECHTRSKRSMRQQLESKVEKAAKEQGI